MVGGGSARSAPARDVARQRRVLRRSHRRLVSRSHLDALTHISSALELPSSRDAPLLLSSAVLCSPPETKAHNCVDRSIWHSNRWLKMLFAQSDVIRSRLFLNERNVFTTINYATDFDQEPKSWIMKLVPFKRADSFPTALILIFLPNSLSRLLLSQEIQPFVFHFHFNKD